MKFDVIVGNPPFSKGNVGKGGNAIYQDFAIKAMTMSPVVAMITPGTFGILNKFSEMREMMNSLGVGSFSRLPPTTFPTANIVDPCYWIVGTGDKKVEEFFKTPETDLLQKLSSTGNAFTVTSGRSAVATSDTINLSMKKTVKHKFVYVDRVRKEGPIYAWCTESLRMNLTDKLAVFSQRGGMSPSLFFVEGADAYSQNVMAIQINSQKEFRNLKKLFATSVYKFILLMASGGKERIKQVGMPAAFTKGKIAMLPAVDLSREWTDNDLYAHLKLTKDEIDIIEKSTR